MKERDTVCFSETTQHTRALARRQWCRPIYLRMPPVFGGYHGEASNTYKSFTLVPVGPGVNKEPAAWCALWLSN